ncbi:MAG: caspase family protein [Planctomycetota bacterium]|nr:caspase family protein [Planctomycetota bacterium]
MRALVVGINEYCTPDVPVQNLQGCLNDVQLLLAVLQSVYGCPANRIRTLLDSEATTANLERAFRECGRG